MATVLTIFLKINCPNFSRLVERRHTKFQTGLAAAMPAIPLLAPLSAAYVSLQWSVVTGVALSTDRSNAPNDWLPSCDYYCFTLYVNACGATHLCSLITHFKLTQDYIHRVRKKGATLFFAITLANPNRSSKFFYRHTQQ